MLEYLLIVHYDIDKFPNDKELKKYTNKDKYIQLISIIQYIFINERTLIALCP